MIKKNHGKVTRDTSLGCCWSVCWMSAVQKHKTRKPGDSLSIYLSISIPHPSCQSFMILYIPSIFPFLSLSGPEKKKTIKRAYSFVFQRCCYRSLGTLACGWRMLPRSLSPSKDLHTYTHANLPFVFHSRQQHEPFPLGFLSALRP